MRYCAHREKTPTKTIQTLTKADSYNTRVSKNCKYNASNKTGNSNTQRVPLSWPTLYRPADNVVSWIDQSINQ